jgi:acylphosphatase
MKATKIEVCGRVQGVFFRVNTREYCEKNEINGTVMNLEDGSVLIVVKCFGDKLRKFVEWIKSSPGMSKAEGVKITKIKINKDYEEFNIIRKDSYLIDKGKALKNLLKG